MLDTTTGPAPTVAAPVAPPPAGGRLAAVLVGVPGAVLTFVLSCIGLGERSLWNDEYATWYASTLSLRDLLRLLDHIDTVVGAYYTFMQLWIRVFGDSPLSLRLPSALAMAAAAALVAVLGRRLFGAGTAVGAGLLFAALPSVSRYGQEARPYAFVIAMATLATLLLLRAFERPTYPRWVAYTLALTFTGLAHFVALTVVAAHLVLVVRAVRRGDDFRVYRWFLAIGAVVTVMLPVAAKGSDQSGAIDWISAGGLAVQHMPEKLFGSYPVAGVVAGAALLGAVLLWRSDRASMALLLTWALAPPLFCYLTFPVLHLFLHRYLLFTLPAWALLAAGAVAALTGRRAQFLLPLGGTLCIFTATMLVGLPGQHLARQSPVRGEPDFRAAAATVSARMEPGDGIAYSGTFRNGRRSFSYELRSSPHPRDVFAAASSQSQGTFGARECTDPAACAGDVRRIWLVTSNLDGGDQFAGMPTATARFLRGEFTSTEIEKRPAVRVLLLARRRAA